MHLRYCCFYDCLITFHFFFFANVHMECLFKYDLVDTTKTFLQCTNENREESASFLILWSQCYRRSRFLAQNVNVHVQSPMRSWKLESYYETAWLITHTLSRLTASVSTMIILVIVTLYMFLMLITRCIAS